MAFTTVPDRATGYAVLEADWDTSIRDNFNTGAWVQLADSVASAAVASFDFQSISGSWAHFKLLAYLRGDAAATNTNATLRFNNDSAANYDYQLVGGTGATATAQEVFAATSIFIAESPAATATANVFGAVALSIPHYANAANNKAVRAKYAQKRGTTTGLLVVGAAAGFWRSNSAISRITVLPSVGNWVAGSRMTLYGLP